MNTPMILAVGGPLQGQSFPVDAHGVRIGRDPANEVVIPTPDVSRHHARVILHNGALWVQDAGSRNGVYVNGNRVSGHKQVSPGDRVVVGNSEFQVGLTGDDENSVSVNMDSVLPGKKAKNAPKAKKPKKQKAPKAARAPGDKQWKIWPFAVAGGVVVVLLGLVAMAGGGDGGADVEPGVTAPPSSRYGLTALQQERDAEKTDKSLEDAPKAPSSFTEGLTIAASASSPDQMKNWPKPPKGASPEDLRFKADTFYDQQRLRDSLSHYQMVLQLDPECNICEMRIEDLDGRIREQVSAAYIDGMRYLDARKYQQAIYSFEKTLLLDPDQTLEETLKAVIQIEETRKKMPRQY